MNTVLHISSVFMFLATTTTTKPENTTHKGVNIKRTYTSFDNNHHNNRSVEWKEAVKTVI